VRAGTTAHAWIASLNQGGVLPYRQSTNNKASHKQGPLAVMTSRDPVHLITECGDFCGCKDQACLQRPVQQVMSGAGGSAGLGWAVRRYGVADLGGCGALNNYYLATPLQRLH
jgi:hypothetical protein